MKFLADPVVILVLGIICVVAGWLLRRAVNRRRFYRRGPFGLQEFDSYNKMDFTTGGENMVKLLGLLLMIGGLFVISIYGFNKWVENERADKNKTEQKVKE